MNRDYHIRITTQALEPHFSAAALARIIAANLYQDRLRAQIGHDEYHFDSNAFDKSYAYLEEQRELVISALQAGDAASAWSAFGRLTHTAQDFYAHSNYIDLWLARHTDGSPPAPTDVDPADPELIRSPDLHSGKVYLPWELLTFIKVLEPIVKPLLPRDAHAWMNLDSPGRGFQFDYAYQAAVKRTVIEFEKTTRDMKGDLHKLFVDR